MFNFSSGPAVMPVPVLERAREEMLSFSGSGMSVMEMSHRSQRFGEILEKAMDGIRSLMHLPEDRSVLFLPGGATLQFTLVPMNLMSGTRRAEYVVTGSWGEKAAKEALRYGEITVINAAKEGKYTSVPDQDELKFDQSADYVHYTSNETIDGVEFSYDLDAAGIPVVCDASSNILSRPFDAEKYALIYAGAQKNIGPSGVSVVVIRNDLLDRTPNGLPPLFDYRNIEKHGSMPNTPNTWAIYMIGLVCDWLKEQGGVEAIAEINERKAKKLYAAIDSSDGFYCGYAAPSARSRMNVTFRLNDEKLEERFCNEAEQAGLSGLRGHRSFGGIRASIYNAFPEEGVDALIEFMNEFAARNG